MRLLPLTEVHEGDVLAATLWAADKRVVLREGSIISESHVQYLRKRGYAAIPVEFPGYEGIEPESWVPDALLTQVVAHLTALPEVFDTRTLNEGTQLAADLLGAVEMRPFGALELLTPSGTVPLPVLAAVNRALIVAHVGRRHFPDMTLTRFITAALLLDSGPGNALQTGLLTDEEDLAQRCERAERTLEYLQSAPRLSPRLGACIRQINAWWDGTGVPPLAGEDIFEGAQLLGPTDRLVRLLVDVPGRPGLPPHEALEWLMGGAGTEHAVEWVTRIHQAVAPYGIGVTVRLSDESLGVVARIPAGWPHRPTVRVLTGPHRGSELDLTQRAWASLAIMGVHTPRLLATTV
jgi:hypothetical protein